MYLSGDCQSKGSNPVGDPATDTDQRSMWSFFYTGFFVMMVVINKRADIFTVISSGQEAIFTDLT